MSARVVYVRLGFLSIVDLQGAAAEVFPSRERSGLGNTRRRVPSGGRLSPEFQNLKIKAQNKKTDCGALRRFQMSGVLISMTPWAEIERWSRKMVAPSYETRRDNASHPKIQRCQ